MSLKTVSLGSAGSQVRGILITSGSNATPIVATITAGHLLRTGDRIGIAGVTTLTNMNGDWTLNWSSDTTYKLEGSVGNGAFAGTAVVAVLCDRTPFLANHSAVAFIGNPTGLVNLVGTVVIEKADSVDATQFYYTNSSGVATAGFTSALYTNEVAIPAVSAVAQVFPMEIQLARYMTFRVSAFTSGSVGCKLMA